MSALTEDQKSKSLFIITINEPYKKKFVSELVDKVKQKWQQKLNIDYAYLMASALNRGQYYLQLEDDVKTFHSFYNRLQSFIETHKSHKWLWLQTSSLGVLGRLFRVKDLSQVAGYLASTYNMGPTTNLIEHLAKLFPCDNKDLLYKENGNPSAKLDTNMTPFGDRTFDRVYAQNGYAHFMGVKKDQYIRAVFKEPVQIERLIIDTGNLDYPKDTLCAGNLSLDVKCKGVPLLLPFKDGHISTTVAADCTPASQMKITATADCPNWLLIFNVEIHIRDATAKQ